MKNLTIQKQRIQIMNDNKQKTPIITRVYALLTIIYIILGISFIGLFYFAFIGLVFIIYSIYAATKFDHKSAILSGITGQFLPLLWLFSFLTSSSYLFHSPIYLHVAFIGLIM